MYRIRSYSFKVYDYELDGVQHFKEEYEGKTLDAIVTCDIVGGNNKKHYLNWAKTQIQNVARHLNNINTSEHTVTQTWFNDVDTSGYYRRKKYDAQCSIIVNFSDTKNVIHIIERITVEKVKD